MSTAWSTASHSPSAREIPPCACRPGSTASVRFEAYAPGTYYYWGTTTGRPVAFRTKEDAQLTGAIVVDPVGAAP